MHIVKQIIDFIIPSYHEYLRIENSQTSISNEFKIVEIPDNKKDFRIGCILRILNKYYTWGH